MVETTYTLTIKFNVIQGASKISAVHYRVSKGRENKRFLLSNLWSKCHGFQNLMKNITGALGRPCGGPRL